MAFKFMGVQGYTWFIGTVEDNNDPQKLGRVKVRCHGFHSENLQEVKTEHLPWALVAMPTTSAGLRNKGHSPTGILVGTQVIGFFADGSAAMFPIVTHVLGGFNNSRTSPEGILPTEQLQSRQQEFDNTLNSETPPTVGEIGPLTTKQISELKNFLGFRESRNNYSAENQFGYVGKYQFGIPALYETGYVNIRSGSGNQKQAINNNNIWTGKNGVNSKQAWFNNSNAQEQACDSFLKNNYNTLRRLGVITINDSPRTVAGYLAVSHLLGPGGARIYKDTGRGADGNGTSGHAYYRGGYNSITDQQSGMT